MHLTRRELSARREEYLRELNEEALAAIRESILPEVAHAIDQARQEATNGEPTGETLVRLAEVMGAMGQCLDDAAKFCAVQAVDAGLTVSEVTSRLSMSPKTIRQWSQSDVDVAAPTNGWWGTAPKLTTNDSTDVTETPQVEGAEPGEPAETGAPLDTTPEQPTQAAPAPAAPSAGAF